MRTRIKICGITRLNDALSAVNLGADAIGFVFFPKSPRAIHAEDAQKIVACLPPFVSVVGLFVDAELKFIQDILNHVQLDMLQFHGNESPQFCDQLGLPYIKSVRMSPNQDLIKWSQQFSSARGLLLDSYKPGIPGGTGIVFDWQTISRERLSCPIILAGGLNRKNVLEAISIVRPWSVDVSTGVEKSPGEKDTDLIADFIMEVNSFNNFRGKNEY